MYKSYKGSFCLALMPLKTLVDYVSKVNDIMIQLYSCPAEYDKEISNSEEMQIPRGICRRHNYTFTDEGTVYKTTLPQGKCNTEGRAEFNKRIEVINTLATPFVSLSVNIIIRSITKICKFIVNA